MIKKDKYITIRFYEELNDFLPQKKKKIAYDLSFFGRPTIKDIIESQGIPHTEIDLLLVNGESVNFEYHINPFDTVSVYPTFELLDITPVLKLRAKPLRKILFVADAHLGKLSRYLRMLGFDTIYRNNIQDDEIIMISLKEDRTILTRDLGILKNGKVIRGYFIRNQKPVDQCYEVIDKFSLKKQIIPFTRCMACNDLFNKVDKKKVKDEIPEMAFQYFEDFYQCNGCGKIYWRGSHYEKMQKMIEKLLSQ